MLSLTLTNVARSEACAGVVEACREYKAAADVEIKDLKLELSSASSALLTVRQERDASNAALAKEAAREPAYFWVIVGAAAGAVGAAFLLRH